MAVVENLVDGLEMSIGPDGAEVTERYLVSGLTGSSRARGWNALNDPGVPVQGQSHPIVPNVFVLNKSIEVIDPEIVKVSVNYGVPRPEDSQPGENQGQNNQGVIRVGSTVQSLVTQKDKDGNDLFVSIDIEETDEDGIVTTTNAKQLGEVEIQIPRMVLSLDRKENGTPGALARTYVGAVNVSPIWGDPERTWLCSRIEGVSNDGGRTYNVTYEFVLNPDGWDAGIVFIDSETDRPHEQVRTSGNINGFKQFRINKERNFSPLNLPF